MHSMPAIGQTHRRVSWTINGIRRAIELAMAVGASKLTRLGAMALILSAVVVGGASSVHAETAAAAPSPRARQASEWLLRDADGLVYRIFASVPEGAPPSGGFPVLYVLDGDAWFGAAAEIARLRELEHGPLIVVGVGYPGESAINSERRVADLTPVPATPQADTPRFVSRQDAFLTFLRTTLREEVSRRYAINRDRQALFGHSLAGVFVLHALFTAPDSFDAFVAASPSIWWNKPIVEREMDAWLALRPRSRDPRILLEVGGLEQSPPSSLKDFAPKLAASNKPPFAGKTAAEVEAIITEEWKQARMVDNVRDLAAKLASAGVQAPLVVFADEHHGSVVPAALSRAMPVALAK